MKSVRRPGIVALIAVGITALPVQPAQAQWVVFDPSNFSQNVLTALRTLQSNVNDVQKIANQIQQLNHEIQNLQTLPPSVSGPLLANYVSAWTQMGNTFSSINGLASNVGALTTNYNATFPARAGTTLSTTQVLGQLQAYLTQARTSYQGVYQQSGEVMASLPQAQANLSAALAASSGASGNLDALQAQTHVIAQVAGLLMQQNAQIAAMNQAESTWLNQQMEAADTARILAQQSEARIPQTQPPAAYLPAMH